MLTRLVNMVRFMAEKKRSNEPVVTAQGIESNEGHVSHTMGAGWPTPVRDADEVLRKTNELLPKVERLTEKGLSLMERVEKFWLFRLLGL